MVDLGGGAWALSKTSPAAGTGDPVRIEAGAVDICGSPLIKAGLASPGALASV
jgi:hypothetical protein